MQKNRSTLIFILLTSLFFIAFFVIENVNKRFWLHDFEVYYTACNAFLHGNQIYNTPFGLDAGYYKYSPFALFLFVPVSILPFAVAKIVHFAALCCFIIFTTIQISKFIQRYFYPALSEKKRTITQYLLILICLLQFYVELHLGNLNIILLLIMVLTLISILKEKYLVSGFLLALGVLLKLHFLLLLPVLFLRKKYLTLFYFTLTVIAGFIFPAIFVGFSKNIEMHQDWITSMLAHNRALTNGLDTLYSMVYRSLSMFVSFKPGALFSAVIFFIVYACCCLLVLKNIISEKKKKTTLDATNNFVFEYFFLLALIPNLTVTDFEHFMFSLPLIAFIVMYLLNNSKQYWVLGISIISFLLYGGNLRDIIGAHASSWMTLHGILGIGNLMIVGISFLIFYFLRQRNTVA